MYRENTNTIAILIQDIYYCSTLLCTYMCICHPEKAMILGRAMARSTRRQDVKLTHG